MHTLIIFAHPVEGTFPHAVLQAFVRGIEDNPGTTAEIVDLHQEGFDPRFTQADHAHFWGEPLPTEIAVEHARVDRSDALVFIFPVYWWGMPALMKGWLDRVLTGGWAWSVDPQATSRGLLKNRPTLILATGGSRKATYEKYGYDNAMKAQLEVGTFAYCGLTDVESHYFLDVEGEANAERRHLYLKTAENLGRAFTSPDRTSKCIHQGSVRLSG
ncbi:NAD(P)H-dependent oxidoreductase [Leptolyngbya sp. FACHB-261]|uniref:NAD(P)H-dependent oxidoreductase n=1 Tax=Leptolyngbya sp. FACHB-261 TaxID=2692806 RepID=UPI0016894EDF|nr:NAD(P)H-dependent oxidoreductase [Leptolyngbya sp. FACHB-261]MBD2104104.1 NAD(P)H-dependent oxidoreductase [Leptolyngbya sp. FACHB-261]